MSAHPTAAAPVDSPARDAIRDDLDHTLFVEAGAGTGKTTALVGRAVQLVRSGQPLRGLAAITFTEAAAAELRERLRRTLEAAERSGEVDSGTVDQLDEAAICTLHAFAQRLLTQFPIEAGLPPVFEVLDEIESSMELDDRFSAFLDELFARPDLERLWLRALACDFKTDRLGELAEIFHDHRDRLTTDPLPVPPEPDLDPAPLIAKIDRLLERAPECLDPDDLMVAELVGPGESWQTARDRLEAADGDELRVIHELKQRPRWRKVGKAAAWGGADGKAAVHTECGEVADAWDSLLTGVRTHIAASLAEEVRQFTLAFAAERAAAGRLVFHDLLVLARDLLRSHPEVREQLAARWPRLLIDEFQDTDPLQLEIAVLLAAPTDAGPTDRHWAERSPEPGRLFFVGDAKQSIYRFRRADIALYGEVSGALGATPVALTTNFRSVPDVLAWVNAVFAELLVEPGGTGGQAPHQVLDTCRPPLALTPAVRVFGGEHDASVGEARDLEAADVAAAVQTALEEKWMVLGRDGHERPVRPSDIAILTPTRTVLPHLEEALTTADLSYRVESASLVWSTQVVRDLLAVLRAIDDPRDGIAVLGALRTSAIACSDQDLLEWHRAGGKWRLYSRLPEGFEADHPVPAGLKRLKDLRHGHWFVGVSDLVDRVAHELPFFELALAGRRPRDHWRQLRFALEQARAFDERPDATLRRFLSWADLQASDKARVREPALPEDDYEAVRIFTIHGAKGLEFPLTVVCGLNVALRSADPTAAVWGVDGLEVRLGKDFATAGFAKARDEEVALARHERARLLYVATTRARDHLLVSLHRGRATSNPVTATPAQTLEAAWTAADPDATLATRWHPAPASSPPSPAGDDAGRPTRLPTDAELEQEVAAWQRDERAWAEQRADLLSTTRRAPVVAATALGHPETVTTDDDKPEPGPGSPVHRRGRAGTSIGRAVHAVLQTVDLHDPTDLEELARKRAEGEQVANAAGEVARLARAAVHSDVVRTAISHRHWRELYVAAPIPHDDGDGGHTVVEGFVDLLYDDGDQLVIVDYKTDAVRSDADAAAAVERYRLQLAAYALALEHTTGRTVGEAVLLFVAGGTARPQWISDLEAAKSAVREALGAVPMG